MIAPLLFCLGSAGPACSFLIALLAIVHHPRATIWFVSSCILNVIVNILLKVTIREPRPDESTVRITRLAGLEEVAVHFHLFGMPSGHAQSAFFILVFTSFLTYRQTPLPTVLLTFLALTTCVQRVVDRRHTIPQVLVGGMVGSALGWVSAVVFYKKGAIKTNLLQMLATHPSKEVF